MFCLDKNKGDLFMFVKDVQVQNLHVLSNAYEKTYNKSGF